MRFLLLLALVGVVAINLKATHVLARSSYYSQKQKIIQLVLVWGLPVIGAILVWSLAAETTSTQITTDLQDHAGYDDGHISLGDASFDGGGDGDGGGD